MCKSDIDLVRGVHRVERPARAYQNSSRAPRGRCLDPHVHVFPLDEHHGQGRYHAVRLNFALLPRASSKKVEKEASTPTPERNWTSTEIETKKRTCSQESTCQCRDTIHSVCAFGVKFYRQIVGIRMGINCAPLVADYFVMKENS